MRKKSVFVILLIITTVVLGFLRDYIFVSINHVIESGNDTGTPEWTAQFRHIGDGFFQRREYLLILKWVLTFVFSISYLILTCAFLFVIFRSKKYVWMAVFAYTALFAVSFLAGGTGMLLSSFEKVYPVGISSCGIYPFVRAVMGIAQSPIAGMTLIAACLINEGTKS